VVAPLVSSAFLCTDFRWIQLTSSFSVDERPLLGGAWISCAVWAGSHSSSFNRIFAVYVTVSVFFCLFLGLFVFSPCNSLLLLYLEPLGSVPTPNHLNWWPRFLTSVSRIFRPASSEALPPRTFFPSLGINCPALCLFFLGSLLGSPPLLCLLDSPLLLHFGSEVEMILLCNLFP